MPEFSSPFSGNKYDRKLTHEELVRAIRFMVAAEYEGTQIYMQLAERLDNAIAQDLLVDIANEERVHAGDFPRLLFVIEPAEKKVYEEGK